MSSEVKQYGFDHRGFLVEMVGGGYVDHTDYAALEAECERLTARNKITRTQLETSLRANEQLRAELASIKSETEQ